MTDEEFEIEGRAFRLLADLEREAAQEAERTHRVAALLAERTTAYYRELLHWEVPETLAFQLVAAYHAELLKLDKPKITYVPVFSSKG